MSRERTPVALTIAGSDSSGGAGIQADLKTFSAFGVYGASVITALTAQNTQGVTDIHLVPPEHIAAQIEAVFSDLRIATVKTGMLGGEAQIAAVADGLEKWAKDAPIIVDPVMVATTGARLLDPGAERLLISRLLPLATLVTPNLAEASVLSGAPVVADEAGMEEQARAICALGARSVLIKGGHGSGPEAVDLFFDGETFRRFATPRVPTRNTHGTGCTLASAIAAGLLSEQSLPQAIADAKAFLYKALIAADGLKIGSGHGPLDHLAAARRC